MSTRTKRFRVGVFVIGASALLAFVLIMFAGFAFWKRTDSYRVVFTGSVIGLEEGAYVYLEGIRVGRVDAIALGTGDDPQVIATIEITEGTPLHENTRALLSFAGITGLKVIDLDAGPQSGPLIPEGGLIAQGDTTLDKLEKKATMFADEASQIMQRATQIVDNLTKITEPSQFDDLAEILDNTRKLSANLTKATTSLDAMIATNSAAMKSTLVAVRETADHTTELIDGHVGTLLENAGGFLTRLDDMVKANEGPLRSAVFDLRQASRNFKELSRDVRQRPSRLLFSPTPSERKLP